MTVASTSVLPVSTGVDASALAFAVNGIGAGRGAALRDVCDPPDVEARGRRDRPGLAPGVGDRRPQGHPVERGGGRADEVGTRDLVGPGADGRVDDRADLREVAHRRRDGVRRRVADDRLAVLGVARRERDEIGPEVCGGDSLCLQGGDHLRHLGRVCPQGGGGALGVGGHPEGELRPVGPGRDGALPRDDDRVLGHRRRRAAGAGGPGDENGENGSDDGQRLHAEVIRRRPDAVSHRVVSEFVAFHTQSLRPG